MSDDKRTNAASFKLALLETVGADPLLKPIDHSFVGAYVKFMKWPQRTAYLTNLTARVLTGMTSEPTISKSRARLVKLGYLKYVMTKLNGAVVYELNNPRAEIVAEHILAATEKLKDMDAYRKEKERQRRARTTASEAEQSLAPEDSNPKNVYDLPEREGQNNFRDSTKISYDNSLEEYLGCRALKGSNNNNSYALASQGY